MAILFNTARSRYPDITGGNSGEFDAKLGATITRVMQAIGARVFQNSFIEDGTMRVPGTSFAGSHISDVLAPSKRRILSQDVQPTVIIKKRMFSTLRDTFDVDYFDEKDRLYIRAIKTLFRKKCEDIAFYESLIFVDKIIEDPDFIYASGALNNFFNALFDMSPLSSASGLLFGATNDVVMKFTSEYWVQQLFKIKEASEQSKQNKFTTWIVDPLQRDRKETGPGIGVMEFTMMSSLDTKTSLTTGAGTCSITLQDPYRLSVITEADIDRAVKEAYLENGRIPSYITDRSKQIMSEAMALDLELNTSRRSRRVSEINFNFPFGTDSDVSATLISLNLPFTETDLIYGADPLSNAEKFVTDLRTGSVITDLRKEGSRTVFAPPDSNIPEDQRFTASETIRVNQIFELLREYKTIQDRAIDEFQLLNNLNSDILDRMRQEFVGHHVIQHMDAIHVFANSFTRNETPIYDSSIAQVSQDLTSSVMSMEDATARISDEFIDQERQSLAPDIPLWIYKLMRNPHVFRGTGPQIWQGIITDVNSDYRAQDGVYTVSIGAKDNMHFLEISRINTSPGLMQFQGALEDPLTPYEIKTEQSTGLVESANLLPENLNRIEAGVIKFHDYPFLGKDVESSDDLYSDTSQSTLSNSRTMRHANGLLYRWKRGILTVTQDININKPLGDIYATPTDVQQDYGLTVLTDVFAKLDSADILSILICGKPYNYNRFVRSALDSSSLTLPHNGSTSSYFDYLFDIFEESNPTNGLFVPAVSAIIDRKKALAIAEFEQKASRSMGSANAVQRRLAQIKDSIAEIKSYEKSDAVKKQLKMLQEDFDIAQASLSKIQSTIGKTGSVKVFGDDIVQHLNDEENSDLTKRLQYTLLKKPEDVRYNRDGNFFVVSDRYSSDLSIQSFVQEMKDNKGFDPFQNTYKYPIEIAKEVSETLHFELFADSQGNIIFRPPEYNKMPLSLMLRLIQLGQTDGVSLIPPFIENLVNDRAQTYSDRLLVLELEIRERVAFLGGIAELNHTADGGMMSAGLQYVTRAHPSGNTGLVTYAIDDVALKEAGEAQAAFTEGTQEKLALDNLNSVTSPAALDNGEIIIEVMSVRNDLRRLIGNPAEEYFIDSQEQKAVLTNELDKYTNVSKNASSERLRLTNEISIRVSRRQILINAILKLMDQQSSMSNTAKFTGSSALMGAFFSSMVQDTSLIFSDSQRAIIPEFLQDMVINDLHNTSGRNSGKRFVIEDDVIVHMNFLITPPEFTRIDVHGAENLIGQGATSVNGVPFVFYAGATDFDMWRQFGHRTTHPETVPYLTNSETQLAPYAVMRLLQERGKIHTGTISVIGNEHYQVGETVYVACKEMLYYIKEIGHNIDLATNAFITTLTLSHGRPLGQYIPQPFDIIGRTLLSDAKRSGLDQRVHRSPPVSSHIKILETVYFSSQIPFSGTPGANEAAMSEFIRANKDKIRNAITKANPTLTSNSNDAARLELRGYVITDASKLIAKAQDGSPVVTPTADIVKAYMAALRKAMTTGINPESSIPMGNNTVFAAENPLTNNGDAPLKVEDKYFKYGSNPGVVVAIDKRLTDDDIKYRRIPSQQAWSVGTRDSTGVSLGLPVNALDIALIIDKNANGDSTGEILQGDHAAPVGNGFDDAQVPAPNDDMGTG